MKRLYKAIRCDNNEWIEGYYFKDGVTGKSYIHHKNNEVNESDKVGEEGCLKFVAFEVYEESVCQDIGLKAVYIENDEVIKRDIWEKDILEVEYENKKVLAEVKYDCSMYILVGNEFADGYVPLFDYVTFEDIPYIDGKYITNIIEIAS